MKIIYSYQEIEADKIHKQCYNNCKHCACVNNRDIYLHE